MNLDPKKTSFEKQSLPRLFDRLPANVRAMLRRMGGGWALIASHFLQPTRETGTDSIERMTRIGLLLTAVLVLVVGGWATFASLNGAVIAHGSVVVAGNTKRVQHKEGGIVRKIAVEDGDYVKAGELLIQLDDTVPRANLDIFQRQIDQHEARKARLEAERDNRDTVTFPQNLMTRKDLPQVAETILSERTMFAARQATQRGQQAQLREEIAQLIHETQGLKTQRAAKSREIQSVGKQLVALRKLAAENYISTTPVYTLEQDQARLEGESGAIETQAAHTLGLIGEAKLKLIQLDRDFQTTVVDDLGKTIDEEAQLSEQKIAAADEARRVRIVAPQAGYVHQLEVHTIGGVVNPGETLLYIVPNNDALVVEVQISPNDIDQVHKSQPVTLRFTSFNQRTSPEINGFVEWVSADLTTDPQHGVSYYTARIKITQAERKHPEVLALVPGMPVEAFVETGSRTALSYFVKPLADQITHVFREE